MRHVYFATGNERKFTEASQRLAVVSPGIKIDMMPVDIPEIQSGDPKDIIRHKVDYVRSLTNLPFLVDDASFETERYPGFPGPYAKFINSTVGIEGYRKLFEENDEIQAIARVALSYLGETHHFEGRVIGNLHLNGNLRPTANNLLSSIMYVSPDVSLGDALQDPNFDNHRGIAITELGKWINAQNAHEAAQKSDIGDRWSRRSAGWKDMIDDASSYVNFEANYARANAMIEKYGPLARGRALEIGCGTGEAGRILKQSNPSLEVLATDISDGMLYEAERQTRETGLDIHYKKADMAKDSLGEDNFGIILSRGVILSHLPKSDVIDYLESVTRHSVKGGYFLFDFIQSVAVGDVEKPVDSKNEFTVGQLDAILGELGWVRIDDDGDEKMRVRVVCYQNTAGVRDESE